MKRTTLLLDKMIKSFLILLLCTAMPMTVRATQPDAYMIITNPGENACKEMRIGWHTDAGVDQCYIEYTKKSDTLWSDAKKIKGNCAISTAWNAIDTQIGANRITQDIIINKYSATLSGLKPDTEYMYRIGFDVMSETKYFKTAGAHEFSFVWISDFHHYEPLPKRFAGAMNMVSSLIEKNNGVDFILSTGDEVAYGGSYSYWKDIFANKNYRDYMWVTTNGNHDNMDMTNSKNSSAFFRDTHNNPQNGYAEQQGVSYWFKYGNVLWIVLNTEDLNNAGQVPKAQEWAASVIKKNKSQYIFFVQHYQWFRGKNGEYNESGFSRWNAFFDTWGVDAAFGGNEHIYVRTHPLYAGKVSTQQGKGTVYLQAPSSDGSRGRTMEPTLTANEGKIATRWTAGPTTIAGSIVTVTETGITLSLYDNNGTLHDYAKIAANRQKK